MIKIALIKKNTFYLELPDITNIYNKPKHDLTQLKDIIKTEIEKFVEFIEIDGNSLVENIINYLDYEQGDELDTETILENKTNVFQICYKMKENPDLGNSLSYILSRKAIFGSSVLISNEYDNPYKLSSITLDNIVDIFMDKIYSQCIFITENGNMTEYYFRDIKEITNLLLKSQNVNKYEIEIAGFKLDIYNTNNSTKTNVIGTRLIGDSLIKGDILIVYTLGDLILSQLHIDELKKIELISLGNLEKRKSIVRSSECNRYVFIEQLYKTYKHECILCKKTDNLKRCTKCYRIIVCSDECFKKYYHEQHKYDCIKN